MELDKHEKHMMCIINKIIDICPEFRKNKDMLFDNLVVSKRVYVVEKINICADHNNYYKNGSGLLLDHNNNLVGIYHETRDDDTIKTALFRDIDKKIKKWNWGGEKIKFINKHKQYIIRAEQNTYS